MQEFLYTHEAEQIIQESKYHDNGYSETTLYHETSYLHLIYAYK